MFLPASSLARNRLNSRASFTAGSLVSGSETRPLRWNSRQLLSSSAPCPVRSGFEVSAVPTIVLVDEEGSIIWRHAGSLDTNKQRELEDLIHRRLNIVVGEY
jgi:hypothetical protein